jgi:outer membrane protein OmpU
MGIEGGNEIETQFHQDLDVTFSMTGETDSGLSFGASVDLDETAAGTDNTDDNSTTVFISGAFGTLTMGDTDGAMDWALTEAGNVGNPGSIDDNETLHAGYIGAYLDGNEDGQILRYDYSVGNLGIAASIELDDAGPVTTAAAAGTLRNAFTSAGVATAATLDPSTGGTADDTVDSGDSSTALGLKYSMDMGGGTLTLGVGYQSASDRVAYISQTADTTTSGSAAVNTVTVADTTAVGVSAVYSANGLSVGAALTQYSDYAGINAAALTSSEIADSTAQTNTGSLTDMTHTSVGIGYTTGALSLHANYGEMDYDAAVIPDVDGYGVAAAYDLGGGAGVHLGMNDNNTGADYSLGIAMSF